jgi:rhodanese-related sulfurtransferase
VSITHVSVTEARALQQDGATYIDVRSGREYESGHPQGSVNVPLVDYDEDTGQPAQNPDFLRVIEANFPRDAKLLIGCQVGGRSMRAAQMLASFGFTGIVNVRGGYGGMRDPMNGRTIDPGWEESGLPIEEGQPAEGSYADMAARADNAQ